MKRTSKGIGPYSFAEAPAEAEEAMMAHPEGARRDLMKLQKDFFAPENVTAAAALQMVAKPRMGEGTQDLHLSNLELLNAPREAPREQDDPPPPQYLRRNPLTAGRGLTILKDGKIQAKELLLFVCPALDSQVVNVSL